MESDIARVLTALVLALPGYVWWRSLRQRNPDAARRYALGVAGLAAAIVAIATVVALAMPAGGGASAIAAIAAMLLLCAAAVSLFLVWGVPPENRMGLGASRLKRAALLFAVTGAIALMVTPFF